MAFLNGETVALSVELRHSVSFRIADPISEDRSLALISCLHRIAQKFRESGSVENIVSENKTRGIISYELLAYDKRLGKSVRRRLPRITEPYTEIASVAKKALEAGKVIRRGNNQNIPYAGQHQN